MGRTKPEATSLSSRDTGRTRRGNENTRMTGPAANENRWVSRLTASGEPGNPRVGSEGRWYALRQAIHQKGENLAAGLDFGGLIEGAIDAQTDGFGSCHEWHSEID
jgi:hypothetical protein